MSVATAPAPNAQVSVTPQDLIAVADDVTNNVLVERKSEMRTILLGATAGKNIHQLGPAGTGKSLGLRAFCARIDGARYFSKTVHALMPADALLGAYDMAEFLKSGQFGRNITNKLPDAHVANIDEVTRANGPTLDSLLPMMNTEERLFETDAGMAKSPLLFMVTASNYMPDPDDPHLGAWVDRLTLMQLVEYVKSDDSFKTMLRSRRERRRQEVSATAPPPVTVTLEQFVEAQRQVRMVKETPEFEDAYAQLRRDAKSEGLGISDRAWMELSDVAAASAWYAGRDFLIAEDLAAVEPGLWRDRADIPTAAKLCIGFQGKYERDAAKFRQEAEKYFASIEKVRPEVEGTPPGDQLDPEVLSQIMAAGRALSVVNKRTKGRLDEAVREQRDAAGLRDLANDLEQVRLWLDRNALPANWS